MFLSTKPLYLLTGSRASASSSPVMATQAVGLVLVQVVRWSEYPPGPACTPSRCIAQCARWIALVGARCVTNLGSGLE